MIELEHPFLALVAWSMLILLFGFLFGLRCGRLDERDRCVKVVRRATERAQPNTWAWSTLNDIVELIANNWNPKGGKEQ